MVVDLPVGFLESLQAVDFSPPSSSFLGLHCHGMRKGPSHEQARIVTLTVLMGEAILLSAHDEASKDLFGSN
ncbi:unnamed protein product [Urochloa humidicola]